MAGLIDSKTRVMDAKLTSRGRMSIADGGLEIKYISFSDSGARYESDAESVEISPLQLGFESWGTSNDEITVTTDNRGRLNEYGGSGFTIRADGTIESSGTLPAVEVYASGALQSFLNQRLISTRNAFFEDPGLLISPAEVSFSVTDSDPFNGEPSVSSIDDVESLFADRRLSKSIRFQYLPPIQRTITTVGNEVLLGKYNDVREDTLTETEIEDLLTNLQVQRLQLSKYTKSNEICMQLFESSSTGIVKLDVVKYGDLQEKTESGAQRSLYFVGKIYEDGYNNPTFINMFNLVLE